MATKHFPKIRYLNLHTKQTQTRQKPKHKLCQNKLIRDYQGGERLFHHPNKQKS